MIWHAVRVWEGSEIAVAARIGRLAYPLVPFELVDGPRLSLRRQPIIPGYVWLGFVAPPDWPALRAIKGVRWFLAAAKNGQPYAFPSSEIGRLITMQAELIADYRRHSADPKPAPQRRRRPRKSRRLHANEMRAALDAMPAACIGQTVELAA